MDMDEYVVNLGVTDAVRIQVNDALRRRLWPGNNVGVAVDYVPHERLVRIRRSNLSNTTLHFDRWKKGFWGTQFWTDRDANLLNCHLLPRMGLTRLEVVEMADSAAAVVCRLPEQLKAVRRYSGRLKGHNIRVY